MSHRWIRALLLGLNLILILVIAGTWGYAWRLDRRVEAALAQPEPVEKKDEDADTAKPDMPEAAATPQTETAATTDTLTTDTATTAPVRVAEGATTPTTTTVMADATVAPTTPTQPTQPEATASAANEGAREERASRRDRDPNREGRRGGKREREGRRELAMAQSGNRPPGMMPGAVPPGAMPPGMMPGAQNGGSPAANADGFPQELTDLMKSKSLFGRMPPPNVKIQGILGDKAMINGQWLAMGATTGPIKLVEILGDKVVLEIDGNRQERKLWQDMPNPPLPPRPKPSAAGGKPKTAKEASPPTPEQIKQLEHLLQQEWERLRETATQFTHGKPLWQKPEGDPSTKADDAPSTDTATTP